MFLSITARHPVGAAVGYTQASSVIVVSASDAESGTVTPALVPSNTSALPNRPSVVHVASLIVPVVLFPEASRTVGPLPSLNPHAATSPPGAPFATVTTTSADTAVLPAASHARADSVWPPFATPAVAHATEYGAVVFIAPSGAPSIRNCTPTTPMLSVAVAVTVTVPDTVSPAAGAVIATVAALVSYVTVSAAVAVLLAASCAVTVSTFGPGCSMIPLAVQVVVPVAVPLPPRLFTQVTCVTAVLSDAVPSSTRREMLVL